ncbi:50S ribosomal protein L11 methyltransferase [Desulfofundulus salinus]|uniref:Ribosomal protein L11 methyltransferase n=1 Tax=Desulfofundulus salinus TaxID=2419843 RepID=A0A494WSE5_9FIRM|nr:50S ribosomal protein L11 methyltransferase [Desulfofundulus salinum]RKO66219.1 50S ribosomal protein L11 methyltransferase [Desulfofundulus salinum]
MQWLEIAITTPAEWVEAVSNMFIELGTGGVAIEDPALFSLYLQEPQDEVALDPLSLPREPVVKAYLPVDENLDARLAALKERLTAVAGEGIFNINTKKIREEDWACSWKAYYKPVCVGRKLVVKPAWEEYRALAGQVVIEMDPGMAFGCGTHPSTRLCLSLLEDVLAGGEVVVDVGTGSGILAIAAALLGARRVVAVDNDPVAVAAARQNVEQNRVQDLVEVVCGDLLANIEGPVDVVVANIVADVIIRLALQARKILKPDGLFIASGIIKGREHDVAGALHSHGFEIIDRRCSGEWHALLARGGCRP